VIPTRNRATLASNAIRSVLDQSRNATSNLVSDNSTIGEEAEALKKFCHSMNERRVRYIRPPAPLRMAEHWEWALAQALTSYDSSHVTYLTDRMIFKADALRPLLRLAARYPDGLICYNHDRIDDLGKPIQYEQVSCSGVLFQLASSELLASAAQLRWNFFPCLPRVLNCLVPRATFATITEHYGSVFLSNAPDCCFGYRYLERFESVLYYDRAPLFHYALDRSNGASQARGVATKDHVDFMANLGGKLFNYAAPIPEITTVWNTIVHEYMVVKEKTQSPKFRGVEKQPYLDILSHEIRDIEDPQLRERFQTLLTKYQSICNCVARPLAWTGREDRVIPFSTVADAIAYGRRHMRRRSWEASTIELNLPNSKVLWRGEGWPAGHARRFYLYCLSQLSVTRDALLSWLNRYIFWRFRSQ
jgi:hypothetical protein